jgi:1,4-dihydroxy-2-naphthoate octaprenyltransferase
LAVRNSPTAPLFPLPPSPFANAATAWFLACRPKTLSVSLSPVLVGTAVAWHDTGTLLWLPLLAAALGRGLIQIGTNLFNDVGDFLRGTDTPAPPRAQARHRRRLADAGQGQGRRLAQPSLAFLCGIYLVAHGGWPIVAIGLASLAAGWAYTGGPKPIAYGPLGEVFVFVFFGLVAVGGSYYLQTLTLVARRADRRRRWSASTPRRSSPSTTTATSTATPKMARTRWPSASAARPPAPLRGRDAGPLRPAAAASAASAGRAALPLLSLPLALALIRRFFDEAPGPVFNDILAATAGLQLAFALLLLLSFTI